LLLEAPQPSFFSEDRKKLDALDEIVGCAAEECGVRVKGWIGEEGNSLIADSSEFGSA
jgi:hypothetical protein